MKERDLHMAVHWSDIVQGIGVKAQLNGELVPLAAWRLEWSDGGALSISARLEPKEDE